MRNQLDLLHGTVAVSFVSATLAGWTVQDWAAFAALFYSLILIGQKIWRGIQWLKRPRT